MPKATIDEVAARAGVTKSTVSHALSGKRPVARETRRRIEAAIAELGYRPNPVAQRLAAGRSRAIGLVFPPGQADVTLLDTPFISAAAAAARPEGYVVALVLPPADPAALIEYLGDGLLDGAILLAGAARDARVEALRESDLPFVLIGRTADNAGLSYVDVDVDAAVDACVQHLYALGHQRIAFLREPDMPGAVAARALQSYELACARRRIRLLTAAGGGQASAAATARLLQEHDITGFVAASEWAGWRAIIAATEAGFRVPDRLSVVCLSGGAAAGLMPFIPTGIDLRARQLAAGAVGLLLERLGGEQAGEQQVLLQPEWIDGSTTAAPRAEEGTR